MFLQPLLNRLLMTVSCYIILVRFKQGTLKEKEQHLQYLSLEHCVTIVVLFPQRSLFYDHHTSSVKYFSMDSIISAFENREKVEF